MRGHTAQMPSSVKCFTRTGKSHAFYDPTLILPCRFCCVSISFQSLHRWWSPESHIPTCFITTFPFCVLVSVLHPREIISTSPASFFLSSSFFTVTQVLTWSVWLRAALQVSETSIFRISTTFCSGPLWKLREEKGGSMWRWENAPPLPCLTELCLSL